MAEATDIPSVLEMEQLPETANYRASRLKLWDFLAAKYLDEIKLREQHGATPEQARDSAAKYLRGEINLFLGELLTHSRRVDVVNFFMAAPQGWPQRGEILFGGPDVPALVKRSYPVEAWAAKVDALDKKIAEDEKSWSAWVARTAEVVGVAAEKVLEGAGEAAKGAGEALGGIFGGFGKFFAAMGNLPTILAATVGVGAVVIGGAYVLKRK